MKLSQYLEKLKEMLNNGRLFDVATELSSYFKHLKQDDFGLHEARQVLSDISMLETDTITPLTKELKKDDIKNRLSKILEELQKHLNPNITIVEENTKPSAEDKEKFGFLLQISEDSVKTEVKTEGGKGTVENSFKGIFKLIALVFAAIVVFLFVKNCKNNSPQPICDCSQFINYQDSCNQTILLYKSKLLVVEKEIKDIESQKETPKSILKKENEYKIRRGLLVKIDSLSAIILPNIQSSIQLCPMPECDKKLNEIIKSLKTIQK